MLATSGLLTRRHPAWGELRAALARLTAPLSRLDCGRPAGESGHGAGACLAARPTSGLIGTRLEGPLMRAAVRLSLGVPSVATHTRLRCVCRADVDTHGAHLLGDCPKRAPGRARRQFRIIYFVRDALAASPKSSSFTPPAVGCDARGRPVLAPVGGGVKWGTSPPLLAQVGGSAAAAELSALTPSPSPP